MTNIYVMERQGNGGAELYKYSNSYDCYERRWQLIEEQVLPREVSEFFFILIFIFYLFFCRGNNKGGEQKDWEMNGIGLHDVNFPKDQFKKLC